MGLSIKEILEFEEIDISFISNKKIAIDSFNMLYQFLASIRQADGSSLTDSKGNVTSHLKGLFNRCVYFKRNNINAVFVFDGKAPELKEKEREERNKKKIEADKKYREALEMGLMEEARKFAKIVNRLDSEMVADSKDLIKAFGFPIIEAKSEGEAQAAHMVKNGQVFASSSQDFDSLLFGAKFLIRNLSVSTRRKVAGSSIYKEIPIEFYNLEKILLKLKISHEDLIILGILCGTDFNIGGIKGIGPKKALKLISENTDKTYEKLFESVNWKEYFNYDWKEVFNIFKNIEVFNPEIEFKEINKEKIREILSKKDFEMETIDRSLNTIKTVNTLNRFF